MAEHRDAAPASGGLGEFELIARYFDREPSRRADLGIGDDCALLRPARDQALAVSTDMLVAGRHFHHDVPPEALGHKALAVNLSDLAAMGAQPRAFVLALALPRTDPDWLEAFSRGLLALAGRTGCELIGGDVTQGPLNLCVTVFGDCPPQTALRRDRAEPEDDVWVSGSLGAAAFAVAERADGRSLADGDEALRRLLWPEPRIALGVALRHLARAAIDLSDGLIGDLGHIADRSRLGAVVQWERVPVDRRLADLPEARRRTLALAGGDDYELVFTAAPENRVAIESLAQPLGLALTRVGSMCAGQGVRVIDGRGREIHEGLRSYDHFR